MPQRALFLNSMKQADLYHLGVCPTNQPSPSRPDVKSTKRPPPSHLEARYTNKNSMIAVTVSGAGTAAIVALAGGRFRHCLEPSRVDHWRRRYWCRSTRIESCDLGCYKPIIGEANTGNESVKRIRVTDLAAHPKVRRIAVGESAASPNLPEVGIESRARKHHLL